MPAFHTDLPGTDLIAAGIRDLVARSDVIRRFMEELAADARADGRAHFAQTFA